MRNLRDWYILGKHLNERINRAVDSCYPTDWQEEFIVRHMAREIRDFLNTTASAFQRGGASSWVSARLFQSSGALENQHGDIAILLRFQYRDGDCFEGVGFLEAKRTYDGSGQFEAIRQDQLKRILRNTPQAYVLLLDHQPINPTWNTWVSLENSYLPSISPFSPPYLAVVGPISVILEVGHRDRRLYKYCSPLAYQFWYRYLNGFDLELDKKILANVKGQADDTGIPSHLLKVDVVHGEGREDIELQNDINLDLFKESD